MQAMKDWHKSHPHLFVKSPRNHAGRDSYPCCTSHQGQQCAGTSVSPSQIFVSLVTSLFSCPRRRRPVCYEGVFRSDLVSSDEPAFEKVLEIPNDRYTVGWISPTAKI